MNRRRCLHCDGGIITCDDPKDTREGDHYAAWLSDYCTPMCQRQAALTAVANGTAWWLRGETR